MTDYREFVAQDVRRIVLEELARQPDYRLNEMLLLRVIELHGHRKSRDWLRDQLRWLEDIHALSVHVAGPLWIAELSQRGRDHAEQRITIEGVARPGPGV